MSLEMFSISYYEEYAPSESAAGKAPVKDRSRSCSHVHSEMEQCFQQVRSCRRLWLALKPNTACLFVLERLMAGSSIYRSLVCGVTAIGAIRTR